MQELRDRVRALTRRTSTWKGKEAVVDEINRVTRGWGNYFALAHYHRIFRQMNGFTANRLREWLWRKHGNAWGNLAGGAITNSSKTTDSTNCRHE